MIKYLILFLAGMLISYYAIMLVSYLILMSHFTFTEWMKLSPANWWSVIISAIVSFVNTCNYAERKQ